jgi:hypothetical protein
MFPVTPQQIYHAGIPYIVIKEVNMAIARNFDRAKNEATVYMAHLLCMVYGKDTAKHKAAIDKGELKIEKLYESYGWDVELVWKERGGNCFIFRPKK